MATVDGVNGDRSQRQEILHTGESQTGSGAFESRPGEVVVSVKSVSKKFCKNLKRNMAYGIADLARNMIGIEPDSTQLRIDEFWALKELNFEIKKGETLGLIGVNGSGKTTLLRLLAGIFPPDVGEIIIRGRVGALIAVGAGFHPHMTGRENIYLNGTILGMKQREITSKIQEIIEFADIGDFLDAPVSTYSSGMRVRLGFSIATASIPDILLIDEILAVGDAHFRNKCYKKISEIRENSAIILVSHSMEQIFQNCTRCLVLNDGKNIFDGSTTEGIETYDSTIRLGISDDVAFESKFEPVIDYKITFQDLIFDHGKNFDLTLELYSTSIVQNITIRIMIYSYSDNPLAEWNSKRKGISYSLRKGINKFDISIGPLVFKTGDYPIGIIVNDDHNGNPLFWSYKIHSLVLKGWTKLGAQISF